MLRLPVCKSRLGGRRGARAPVEKTYRAAAAVQHNAHTLQTPYRDAAAVKHNAHLPVLLLLFNTTLGLTEVRNAVPIHTQTGTAPIILRKSEVHRRTHRRVALQTCGADFQGHQATVFRFNLT
jgi:hypothetical protein